MHTKRQVGDRASLFKKRENERSEIKEIEQKDNLMWPCSVGGRDRIQTR